MYANIYFYIRVDAFLFHSGQSFQYIAKAEFYACHFNSRVSLSYIYFL